MEEGIIAANYWENWKFAKELDESLGGNHPKSVRQREMVNKIRDEWNEIRNTKQEIKTNELL